jgi:hypothetical protein
MINHADQTHTTTAAKLATPVAELPREVLQTRPEDTTHEKKKKIHLAYSRCDESKINEQVMVWDQHVWHQSGEMDYERSIPVHGNEISLLSRHCVQTRSKPHWDSHPIRTRVSFPVIKPPAKSSPHNSIWYLNLEYVDVRLHPLRAFTTRC